MAPSRNQLLQTAYSFIEKAADSNVDKVMTIYSRDSVHRTAPASLGESDRSHNEMAAFLKDLLVRFNNLKFTLAPGAVPIIDETNQKIVLHLKGTAESAKGPYNNEYIWILTTNDDGTLVKDAVEFLDSASLKEYVAR